MPIVWFGARRVSGTEDSGGHVYKLIDFGTANGADGCLFGDHSDTDDLCHITRCHSCAHTSFAAAAYSSLFHIFFFTITHILLLYYTYSSSSHIFFFIAHILLYYTKKSAIWWLNRLKATVQHMYSGYTKALLSTIHNSQHGHTPSRYITHSIGHTLSRSSSLLFCEIISFKWNSILCAAWLRIRSRSWGKFSCLLTKEKTDTWVFQTLPRYCTHTTPLPKCSHAYVLKACALLLHTSAKRSLKILGIRMVFFRLKLAYCPVFHCRWSQASGPPDQGDSS